MLAGAPSLRRMDQAASRELDRIVKTDAPEPRALRRRGAAPPPARRRLHAGGAGADPASDGGGRARKPSARWATTRRSPCCPIAIAACTHYFRQNFSQVTNPPIDSLRETRVMTLKTRLGNLGNVLDEDAEPVRPAAARKPGAVHRRVRARCARIMGRPRLRDRLHLPGRRRRGRRCARAHRAHPRARPRKACAPAARTSS